MRKDSISVVLLSYKQAITSFPSYSLTKKAALNFSSGYLPNERRYIAATFISLSNQILSVTQFFYIRRHRRRHQIIIYVVWYLFRRLYFIYLVKIINIAISLHLHAQPPSSSPCLIRSRGHKPSIVRSGIASLNSHSTYSPYLKPEPLYHRSPLAWNNLYIIFGPATNRMHIFYQTAWFSFFKSTSPTAYVIDVLIQRAYLELVNPTPLADAGGCLLHGEGLW